MSKSLKEHNFFGFDATVVADSTNVFGDRLTTMVVTFPRIVLAEFNTHRMFSRNSASSRAIPYNKMVERVKSNPFIPVAFQKDHTGMQGTEYFTDPMEIGRRKGIHLKGRDWALVVSKEMSDAGVTKQICNRYLEPFLWHTVIVSATDFENFFALRCPQYEDAYQQLHRSRKDYIKSTQEPDMQPQSTVGWLMINKSGADIHIQPVAEAMWNAMNESKPKLLEAGEWHIPFREEINLNKLYEQFPRNEIEVEVKDFDYYEKIIRKIATALCARLSYGNITADGDYTKDVALYDRLASVKHASPFEHCAQTMTYDDYHLWFKGKGVDYYQHSAYSELSIDDDVEENVDTGYGWCLNFKGFIQERALAGLQ